MSTNQKDQIAESTMKKMNSQILRELIDIAKKHNTCCYYKVPKADFIIRTFDSEKQSEQSTLKKPTPPPNNQKFKKGLYIM